MTANPLAIRAAAAVVDRTENGHRRPDSSVICTVCASRLSSSATLPLPAWPLSQAYQTISEQHFGPVWPLCRLYRSYVVSSDRRNRVAALGGTRPQQALRVGEVGTSQSGFAAEVVLQTESSDAATVLGPKAIQ